MVEGGEDEGFGGGDGVVDLLFDGLEIADAFGAVGVGDAGAGGVGVGVVVGVGVGGKGVGGF